MSLEFNETWIERSERLKREWTDKYVVVDESVPALRRFAGWTGIVKTVNMNCRALVEFQGTEDISWYDVDPDYLKVVEAPAGKTGEEKEAPAEAKQAAPAKEAQPAAKKPAAGGGGAKSVLEKARAQDAGKTEKAGAAQSGGGASSVLEKARQQDAKQKSGGEQAGDSEQQTGDKKLSPAQQARMQDSKKSQGEPAKAQVSAGSSQADSADEQSQTSSGGASGTQGDSQAASQQEKQQKGTSTTDSEGRKLSVAELARRQGPAKR